MVFFLPDQEWKVDEHVLTREDGASAAGGLDR